MARLPTIVLEMAGEVHGAAGMYVQGRGQMQRIRGQVEMTRVWGRGCLFVLEDAVELTCSLFTTATLSCNWCLHVILHVDLGLVRSVRSARLNETLFQISFSLTYGVKVAMAECVASNRKFYSS